MSIKELNGIFIELFLFDKSDDNIKSQASKYIFFISDGSQFKTYIPDSKWEEVEDFINDNPNFKQIYYTPQQEWDTNQETEDYINFSYENGWWPSDEDPLGAVVDSINCKRRGYPSINFYLVYKDEIIYKDCLN